MQRRFIAKLLRPEALSVLLAVALYAVTLRGGFVYDDWYIAEQDPRVHDVHRWGEYLTQGYFPDGMDHLWRPATSLSFAIQAWLQQGISRPASLTLFHLVNVLLHAIAAGMVARLALRTVSGRLGAAAGMRAAYVAGLLFAAHPVHVEVVATLVGRAESLAVIGILGAILAFTHRPLSVRGAFAVFGWFCLAVFSKEQGLLLPLFLLAWFLLDPPFLARDQRAGLNLCIILLTLGLTAYINYRGHILDWNWDTEVLNPVIQPLAESHAPDRWLLLLSLLGRYTALLFAPVHLSLDYGGDVIGHVMRPNDPYFDLGIAALLAYMAAVVFTLYRRWRVAAWALLCMGISYLLISNLKLIGTIFNERLIYLPSVFFCLLIGVAASHVRSRAALTAAMTILLLAGAWKVVPYAASFNNQTEYMRVAHLEQPQSAMLALLYAQQLEADRRFDEAAAVYDQVCAQFPHEYYPWMKAAEFDLDRGNLAKAKMEADRAFDVLQQYPTMKLRQRIEAAEKKVK